MDTFFHLELSCEETNSTKKIDLDFPSLPDTFLEIKKEVERRCSIPVCVQTLYYQSSKKADSDCLISSYIRSEDTFLISYPIEGECESVKSVVTWLKRSSNALQTIFNVETPGIRTALAEDCIPLMLGGSNANDLSVNLFYPWSDKTKYVNKLHFDSLGGVEFLMSCYGSLQKLRQRAIRVFRADFYETVYSLSVANFTQTFPLRRQIVKYGGLDYCINTFLWGSLDSGLSDLLISAIEVSLYAICNISELPEMQLKLAQRSDVIEQTFQVSISPLYPCKVAIVGASFLLCLAQCHKTHFHLLQPSIVENILKICEVRKAESELQEGAHFDAIMALESYVGVVLSQMILGSVEYLLGFPDSLLEQMVQLMERVCGTNPVDIRTYEIKEGLVWGTFLPFLNYLYSPVREIKTAEITGDLVVRLQSLSAAVIIHSLQNALGRELHLKILKEEGLLDYIVALPWHVPENCRERARNLVHDVSKLVQIELPLLSSLTKAQLAKMSLGLKEISGIRSVTDLCMVFRIQHL